MMKKIIELGGKKYTRLSVNHEDYIDGAICECCEAVCKSDIILGTKFHSKEYNPKLYEVFKNNSFFKIIYIIFENGLPVRIYDKYDNFIMDADLKTKEIEMNKLFG